MLYEVSKFKIEDYNRWKTAFDRRKNIHKSAGVKSTYIFHPSEDPNNVVVLREWDNLDNARKYLKTTETKEVKESMKQAGIIGQTETIILEEVEKVKV